MVNLLGILSTDPPPKTELNISNDTLNESISNTMNKVSNNESTVVTLNQSITMDFSGADIECENFDVTQKINAQVKIISSISATMATEIRKTVKDSFDSSVDQSAKASTDIGAAGTGGGDTTTNIKNTLHTLVEDNLSNETLNQISNKFQADQTMTIHAAGMKLRSAKACSFDQDIQLTLMAQSMIDTLTKAAKDSTEIQQYIQTTKQATEAQGKGLTAVVDSAGATAQGLLGTVGSTFNHVADAGASVAKSAIGAWAIMVVVILGAGVAVVFIGSKIFLGSPALQQAVSGALGRATGGGDGGGGGGGGGGEEESSSSSHGSKKKQQHRAKSVLSGYAPFPPLPAFAGTRM